MKYIHLPCCMCLNTLKAPLLSLNMNLPDDNIVSKWSRGNHNATIIMASSSEAKKAPLWQNLKS